MNIQEKNIALNAEQFKRKLPFLNKLHGLRCEIFYPLENLSHYQNSSKFSYNELPDETRRIIVTNQLEQLQQGNNIYDPFNPEPVEAIVDFNSSLLDNSKIKVYKGTSFTEYRVDINSTLVTGINDKPLYYRYKLIPVI